VISPLLANVFLHYVLDVWIQWWRSARGRGEIVVIRYADDFVIGLVIMRSLATWFVCNSFATS
jgi:hypothetical protein